MSERELNLVCQDNPGDDVGSSEGRATSTARVRDHRRRRREGMQLARLEVRPNEIAFLTRQGFLDAGDETDAWALARAVGRFLDLLVPELEAGRIIIRSRR